MVKKRSAEIDIAKGFAIVLVIIGHIVTVRNFAFLWIFSFHMPLFFFLSGMTFKPEKYPKVTDFVKNRGRKLIGLYLAVVAAAVVICMIRPDYRELIVEDGFYWEFKWIFWYGQPWDLYVGQVWFLVGLFMAELITWIWIKAFDKRPVVVRCFALVILALIAIHTRDIFAFMPGSRLPWKIDTGLMAAVFVICGYYTARAKLPEKLTSTAVFIVPFCIYLNCYFGPMRGEYVNICDCLYNAPPYYFAAAFTGIAAVVMTSYASRLKPLSKLRPFWHFWQFCGRYSLPLFIAQTFVIYFWVEMIERFTGVAIVPMHTSPNILVSLAIAAATLFLMLAFIYPWYLWQCKKHPEKRLW